MVLSNSTGRLAPQSMLRDRYIILGLAGRGGMGSVYKATDTLTSNRLVAIKEMSQAHLGSEKLPEAQERFRLEAEMLGKLSHSNLPRVLDSFTEAGRSYLVMDLIDGKTLLQLLTESPEHRLSVEQILRYAIQLCTVLEYLHAQSPPIIFRDLKPSNVMVNAQGQVFLIDFGIARHFTQGKLQDTIPLGSEGFCPPEQFGTGQTSPRSDLYSLGATLHYSLTGKNPRSNKPTLFDFSPLTEFNPQVPGDLNKLILWLLATREEQRPQSAAQVRQLLLAIEQWTTATTHSTVPRKSKTLQLIRMNSGQFYDTKTARAAQSRQWLSRFNVLPGRAGSWSALVLIPFLALLYGQVEAWLLLFVFPVFQRVEHLGSTYFRRLAQHKDTQASFLVRVLISPIWTPYFVLIFFLMPLLLSAGCFYLLNGSGSPPMFVAFCLCCFLLVFTLGLLTSPRQHSAATRNLLLATVLALSLLLLLLLSFPPVQSLLRLLTINQLVSVALPGLSLLSLLRPQKRFAWSDHLSMALTIAVYGLLQYSFGLQELAWLGESSQVVNTVLVGLLGGIALMAVVRLRRPFTWAERVLLCAVSCICVGLQYTFGLREIVHAPLMALLFQRVPVDPLDLVSLNILLAARPTLLTLLWLFFPLAQRSHRLARIPLLFLALTAAGLQNFLGPSLNLPPFFVHASPLALPISGLLSLAQLLACLLCFLGVFLGSRLMRRFHWLDHGAIFTVSLSCALLQSTAWDKPTLLTLQRDQPPLLLSSSIATLNQPQFYTAACNKLLAQGLMFVVLSAFFLVGLLLTVRLLSRVPRFQSFFAIRRSLFWPRTWRFLLRLEHALLLVVTLTCFLLYWFFGMSTSLLRFSPGPFSLGQLFLALLLFASLLALVRIARPSGRIERLIVQLDALACALLLVRGPLDSSPLQAVQNWQFSLTLPSLLFSFGLVLTCLFSLLWLKRRPPSWSRNLLLTLLFASLLCSLLQGSGYFLVLVALILLLEGVFLAVQLDQ